MEKILIVDDEASIRELIKMMLSIAEYETEEADNGETAIQLMTTNSYDLIILDVMLPKLDGYQVLQKIKDLGVPIMFLSAKIALQDRILGLKLGADDYITKPFEPIELLTRIETLLRRAQRFPLYPKADGKEEKLIYRDITLHEKEHIVKWAEKEVTLTLKEYDLLNMFLKHQNIVLSREVILNRIWGYDYVGGTRTIDMHVKQLREKLGLKQHLETVYKIGYKLKG